MVHIYLARLSWWQDDAYFVKLLNIDILLNIFSCVLFWSTYLIWLICEIFLAVTSFQRWFLIFLKCFRLWPLLIIEYQILFETYLLWTHLINVQKKYFCKIFLLVAKRGSVRIHPLLGNENRWRPNTALNEAIFVERY